MLFQNRRKATVKELILQDIMDVEYIAETTVFLFPLGNFFLLDCFEFPTIISYTCNYNKGYT